MSDKTRSLGFSPGTNVESPIEITRPPVEVEVLRIALTAAEADRLALTAALDQERAARADAESALTTARAELGHAQDRHGGLEETLRLAEDLGGECVRVVAGTVAAGVAQVVRDRNVGMVVLGSGRRSGVAGLLHRPLVLSLIAAGVAADLHLMPHSS